MAGSKNDTHYSRGYNLYPTSSAETTLLQMQTDATQLINVTGNPNGVVPANPGSLAQDRTNGALYLKVSGTGVTVWQQVASGTLTDLHTARFIVGNTSNGANYSTITAALAAASSGNIIYIQEGTYTENLTLKNGVNLCSFGSFPSYTVQPNNNVTIVGKLIDNGSVVQCNINGINLQTNSDYVLVTSAASSIYLYGCQVSATNSTPFNMSNSSANIHCKSCNCNLGTTGISMFTITAGDIFFYETQFTNTGSSVTGTTLSDGNASFFNCEISCPLLTSVTGFFNAFRSTFDTSATNTTAMTTGGNQGFVLNHCFIGSGSASAISIGSGTIVNLFESIVKSTNTNAITGAGTLNYSGLVFNGTSSLINTTSQSPLVFSNNAVKVVTPGAYPYTTVPQDGVILVDSSSARTIVPLASPTTGQMHRIKDNVGSAAANNITITPSGKNIDGAASYTIAANYGSVDIVYNGTQWNVL